MRGESVLGCWLSGFSIRYEAVAVPKKKIQISSTEICVTLHRILQSLPRLLLSLYPASFNQLLWIWTLPKLQEHLHCHQFPRYFGLSKKEVATPCIALRKITVEA